MTALQSSTSSTYELTGDIASVAFSSGHRFVVGRWDDSPVGPMCDVMWARPDGQRLLLVGRRDHGEFIAAVYRFDHVDVVPLECVWDESVLHVTAGDVILEMTAGRGWRIPLGRLASPGVTRWIQGPVARRLLGVRVFGTSPTGVREWYRADRYRPVVAARASWAEESLGSLCRFDRPTGFGFSEPPRRPSVVRVRPLLADPAGRLDAVVARLRQTNDG